MGRNRRARLPEPAEADIESLSHDGRGVAHVGGKVVFIHGALPGERVVFRYTGRRRQHDEGQAIDVLRASAERCAPRCAHYGVCGGCSLQHLEPGAQIAAKQQALLDALAHIGQLRPREVYAPLRNAAPWGYRRKARLGVKYVAKKGKVLVGFRERASSFVADLGECHVLHPRVGRLLPELADLVEGLSIARQLPQIEVAMDDERLVLVFRVLTAPNAADQQRLRAFAAEHVLGLCLQSGGPDTVTTLAGEVDLRYRLPAFELELRFLPTDFTQVNVDINRQMVGRAVELLAPEPGDRVLDLFCGIGNFTLPLARRAGTVVGVEGDAALVQRARDNAARNGVANVRFFTTNLYEPLEAEAWLRESYDKVLLDPPRSGAFDVLEPLGESAARRIVYVSCYPGTLARDAAELVQRHGFTLAGAGVMDMFPHTSHVESIALFERS
jgi:23S rRNA (uracil1939-C5)-methyltransferase